VVRDGDVSGRKRSDGGLDAAPRVLREYGVNVGSKRSVTGSERWRTGDDPLRRNACSETQTTIAHARTYDSRRGMGMRESRGTVMPTTRRSGRGTGKTEGSASVMSTTTVGSNTSEC